MSWRPWDDDQRACEGMPLEAFFPVSRAKDADNEALACCEACPIRTGCLEWALGWPEQYGTWGGMTAEERSVERRRRQRRALAAARRDEAGAA